jgi:uncharacterized membrane protein
VKVKNLKLRIKYVFGALIILYPILVFSALVVFKMSIRYLSIFIIVLAAAYVVINRQHYHGRHPAFIFITPSILFAIGLVCLLLPMNDELAELIFRIYPALADLVYLTILTTSLFIPPPLVHYFINTLDKKLIDNLNPAYYKRFCRNTTIIWCVFFVLDAVASVFTVFWTSKLAWGIYNGGVTYVLMGLIFAGEYIVIKIIEKNVLALRRQEQKINEVEQEDKQEDKVVNS